MSGGGEGNLDVDIFDLLSEKETYFTLHTRQMSKGEKITQLVDYSNKINDEILKRQRLLNNTNSANNKNKLVGKITFACFGIFSVFGILGMLQVGPLEKYLYKGSVSQLVNTHHHHYQKNDHGINDEMSLINMIFHY